MYDEFMEDLKNCNVLTALISALDGYDNYECFDGYTFVEILAVFVEAYAEQVEELLTAKGEALDELTDPTTMSNMAEWFSGSGGSAAAQALVDTLDAAITAIYDLFEAKVAQADLLNMKNAALQAKVDFFMSQP
jgi:hypothetical protein